MGCGSGVCSPHVGAAAAAAAAAVASKVNALAPQLWGATRASSHALVCAVPRAQMRARSEHQGHILGGQGGARCCHGRGWSAACVRGWWVGVMVGECGPGSAGNPGLRTRPAASEQSTVLAWS